MLVGTTEKDRNILMDTLNEMIDALHMAPDGDYVGQLRTQELKMFEGLEATA